MMKNSNGYRLGLYEKAMPSNLTWEERLTLTRESGFDWMEISIDETDGRLARLDYTPAQMKEIADAIANTGVPIHTMCLSGHRKYPLGSRDESIRSRSLEIMEKALIFSSELGIRLIQLAGYDVYYEEGGADTTRMFEDNLGKITEMASAYGVNMGFETMETPFMDTTEKGMKYVLMKDSPYLGMYPDIGNLKNAAVKYGISVVDDLRTGKGHIFASHLKETNPGIYRDMLFGSGGHTEYVPCIQELWQQGVRMFTAEFWYQGEPNYRENLVNAGVFLRDKIEKARSL